MCKHRNEIFIISFYFFLSLHVLSYLTESIEINFEYSKQVIIYFLSFIYLKKKTHTQTSQSNWIFLQNIK